MAAPSVTAATILIVDDEETNLYALRLILESKGYRCLEASSGPEAIQIAAAATPEVVLLDIHMPEMDGYEVCRRLKADARTESIPIIFLTARYRDHDEIARGLDAGAHDYVTKPFSAPELLARIGVMVRIQRAEAEARRASMTDSLTGLHNRRFLHQRLEEEMARSRRHASPPFLPSRHSRHRASPLSHFPTFPAIAPPRFLAFLPFPPSHLVNK